MESNKIHIYHTFRPKYNSKVNHKFVSFDSTQPDGQSQCKKRIML